MLQKHFPQVRRLVDAEQSVAIEVTKRDVRASEKDPHNCAVARACVRAFQSDGVIVLPSTTFLVKGKTAKRYRNTPSIQREITSFDRHGGFEPGFYRLMPADKNNATSRRRKRRNYGGGMGKPNRGMLKRHRMTNVRTVRDLR